jgi:hypothetical protein
MKCFGVRFEDRQGKTDFELWPREVAGKVGENNLRVLRENRTIEVVEEVTNQDGTTSWRLTTYVFNELRWRCATLGIDYLFDKSMEFERVTQVPGAFQSRLEVGGNV